jgi:glycosyltransferase involved in cell wall biosynthesis
MIKVSIIITVYNGESYLRECLNSILTQTLDDLEIICVNDASTDHTLEILKEYADKIIVLTNKHNLMAGESRNRGFAMAQGEYVVFLDSDDLFEPDMLKKAYQKASDANAEICIFKEDQFTDKSELHMGYPYAENLMDILGQKSFFPPSEVSKMIFNLWNGWAWDKIFNRQFLIEKGLKFQNIKTSEDGYLVHAALVSAKRITFVNKELVHHRIGNTNSLSNSRSQVWTSCFAYLRELQNYLSRNHLMKLYESSFINWTCDFLYWNYQTINKESRTPFFNELQKYIQEEIDITKYEIDYYYNSFSFKFIQYVICNNQTNIPISEQDRFLTTYNLNKSKIEKLYLYFVKKNWKIALWGVGIRGQAFLDIYGQTWNIIIDVFDMDKKKHGIELYNELKIKPFDVNQIGHINCILVLNSAHISMLKTLVKGIQIAVFDLNTYLTLPQNIEECLLQ